MTACFRETLPSNSKEICGKVGTTDTGDHEALFLTLFVLERPIVVAPIRDIANARPPFLSTSCKPCIFAAWLPRPTAGIASSFVMLRAAAVDGLEPHVCRRLAHIV
jgi:hypothetical protein